MSTATTSHTPGTSTGHAASDTEAGLAATAAAESTKVLQKLLDKKDAVVESMQPRIDAVSSFARNDPTKAVLISAATGAGLMALIALVVRASSSRPTSRARSAMATIRDAALDLADRAHSAATDAITATHERASTAQDHVETVQKRAAELQKRASDAASAASDSASETWQNIRDQAAPVIERFRPQIDAVTSYAKEDPTRAALGAAAAGAVLLGVIALLRRSGD